jgi:hypothetical protein
MKEIQVQNCKSSTLQTLKYFTNTEYGLNIVNIIRMFVAWEHD